MSTPPDWTVGGEDIGLRLDKFLAAATRLGSRGRAVTALERGKVLVNGADVGVRDAAYRLAAGDVVRVWMDRPGSAKRRADADDLIAHDLGIVYDDDALIVLNKPAGMLAVPLSRKREALSVFDRLEDYFRTQGKRRRPFVVHRIDRDTSGLVVFAKHQHAMDELKGQFRRREPERVYLSVVYGHPDPEAGEWQDHLVWDDTAMIQKETHPRDPNGKEAISHYRVLETFKTTSLLEVRLTTGKRNQIRIQARLRGHTLVGEQRYVFGPDYLRNIPFKRQALHAAHLGFRHPATGALLQFDAPLPADFAELLARLRRRGPT